VVRTHRRLTPRRRLAASCGQASTSDVAGLTRPVAQGDLVAVQAGTRHNFRNTGVNPLILYTVYGPPEHADGVRHATKQDSDVAEPAGQDQPSAA
jgi:oxalate decarboxylase/phosphoglucose isomerase-like protein (cupin superfamily)